MYSDGGGEPGPGSALLKRTVDIVLGSLLCVLALPLMLAAVTTSAAALRTWPLFVQERPGLGTRPFRILKVRTLPRSMPVYGDRGVLETRVTTLPSVCRLLRQTHLDELPQLLLVPPGKMSLVGPRPSLPLQYEHIDDRFAVVRTTVRPGCTGLWQIGVAHEHSQGDDPEFDVFYLQRMSLRLDLWVLGRTALFMAGLARPIRLADIPVWAAGGTRRTVALVGLADRAATEGADTPVSAAAPAAGRHL